ncbi:hypothetical protein RhiirA5_423981 [Rhizophagus irregularis]|uniref:Uncharacterized protein n=1 Tax=Rhizophagus irregularis TaxID=588596 RepID=A0A2N0P901_9GLOM|nr:hypothetical protein RhiirA5_423981 [Rhizophagus irregularis]GBC16335.2 hypothetical protein GLOIN_2v1475481 [Rhizophagus irregularis DAOM 181602=DAOM 197198]CAB5380372.1 unnamed protein product [Rhizophagus irregularis]CAG8677601.1 15206_t:CDS:2 [Rhizophagus irregularis]
MPKTRGNFWFEYEVTVDSNGKEKYTCKTCSGIWSKNASHLKEHIEKCKDINVETETSQPQGTKRKRQQTFDEYKFAFTSKDQIILESLLIQAFCSADQEFEHLKLVVNLALSKSPTYCLISDRWSNIQRTSIVNYIISTLKLLFFKATAFKKERHTAENIALRLETTMKDAGINKFGAIITDNAPNMKAA